MKIELGLLIGGICGAACVWLYSSIRKKTLHTLAKAIIADAEKEALEKKKTTLTWIQEEKKASLAKLEEERKKLEKEEHKLHLREEKFESKLQSLIKKLDEIEKKEEEVHFQINENKKLKEAYLSELKTLAAMNEEEVKDLLFKQVENEIALELLKKQKRLQEEMNETIDREVAVHVATALNRLALPVANELATTTVALPNEEMKGRVIGREGRNIRCLEMLTGVNFVVDEVPGAIVLSCFDPVRKQIAKIALTELIQDGRIHPTRIEELVERAKVSVEKYIIEKGESAVLSAGIFPLHPELTRLLGKLSLQYSYGQNVLSHSLEVAHIMGLIAEELGLQSELARRIGLLHDIGKALTHEMTGSHAILGKTQALKYGESEEVANGIGCHHHEIPPITIEGSLCSTADQISGGRLGARSEAIEQYVRRLGKLEAISSQYPGVEKAYALQAGREVRVIVLPEVVDDQELKKLARTLACRIEKELTYPGKIKVTVIREKKAIEYAT